jgi:hypothetical protein
MKNRLLGLVLLCSCVTPTLAGGAGPMWVFPVGRLCIAQEPQHAKSFLGNFILQGRMKLDSPEFTQCAKARHWIPDHICSELMSLDSEKSLSRSNLERLGAQWSDELKVLRVAGPYTADAAEAEESGRTLPSCP